MIFEDPHLLKDRITGVTRKPLWHEPRVFEDTSEFMSIDVGSVLRLGGHDYLVMGHGREGRFGLDEEPKFWAKIAVDLDTGERKIVKLVFYESFTGRLGDIPFHCIRSPEKESRILEAMRGNPFFMQGRTVPDRVGNPVRILDFIPGPSLYVSLRNLDMPHEAYYHEIFPGLMRTLIECIEAIALLHRAGFHHGDIRADHILLSSKTNHPVWIDFDYHVSFQDYDLFCLGNVLQQVVGKGRHSVHDIRLQPSYYPGFNKRLGEQDMLLMFPHRVANLRKLFPHIPADMNDILMRFSLVSKDRYRDIAALLSDLHALFPAPIGNSVSPGHRAGSRPLRSRQVPPGYPHG